MPEDTFRPIRPNPFIVGNPVRDRTMFFGRESEFQLIRKRFADSSHGGIIVFCGDRRSGKTSILFQVLDGRLGSRFLPVLIDMQSMAVQSEAEFYRKITSEIAEAMGDGKHDLEIPDYQDDHRAPMLFQQFVSSLITRFPDRRPILLVDEYELLETKIEAGILSPDVLNVFGGLLERHAFFLVFTGSNNLEERKEAYWRILGQSIHRRISYLERSDAIDLITRPVEGRVMYDDGTIDLLYRLGAGQPFYTQALCQILVDHLNEERANRVTPDAVQAVVRTIINNPFPQMIFLWDSLSPDEKLTLALLAEALPEDDSWARTEDLQRVLREKRYPLDVGAARLSAALEDLFQKELLVKHTDVQRGFAYRMDLWRQWILREHSVWRVIREEKIPTRRRLSAWQRVALAGGLAAVLLVSLIIGQRVLDRGSEAPTTTGPAPATLSLDPVPRDASVTIDGEPAGKGPVLRQLAPETDHEFLVSAPGHADSSFTVRLTAGESIRQEVALRPLRGAVHIVSEPSRAAVFLDGTLRGQTPLLIAALDVNREYDVRVELVGHQNAGRRISVSAADTTEYRLDLDPVLLSVLFSSTPAGATVTVDGRRRGASPVTVGGLSSGPHRVRLELEGYETLDSLMTLSEATPAISVTLSAEPPGILVVLGDVLARRIYIDEALWVENVHNSGPCTLSAGQHLVQVDRADTTVSREIDVGSGTRVLYDYAKDEVR